MTIAIDTNILVYAHRDEMPRHKSAVRCLRRLAGGTRPLAIPWPCIYEFLKVVTHPGLLKPPSPMTVAWRFVQDLLRLPMTVTLSESEQHSDVLDQVLREGGVQGNLVHDAHIAALLVENGVQEIVTEDRDFHRFRSLQVVTLDSEI